MRDYLMAVGDRDPYGFSAIDDRAAVLHALDVLDTMPVDLSEQDPAVTLSGPDGCLTQSNETIASLRRADPVHLPHRVDDVEPADPTPPDCNMA